MATGDPKGMGRDREVPERNRGGAQASARWSGWVRGLRPSAGEEQQSTRPGGEVGVAAAREELQIPGGVTPRGGRGGLGRGGPERD